MEQIEAPQPAPATLSSPRKKWKIEEHSYRIDIQHAKPIPWEESFCIHWAKQLISYHIIAGYESTGVILAELEYKPNQKGCIIIKGMENICSEMFATFLAHSMNILAPKVRLVEYAPHIHSTQQTCVDNEWHYIKQSFDNPTLIEEHKVSIADKVKADKMLNMAFFLIYEYIPSQLHLSNLQHEETLVNDCNPQTNQIWFDLGRIVVVDMLINNFDRLPCEVWDNHGNLNNVMILRIENTTRAVAIDQSVFCIDKQKFSENYCKYRSKVKSFFERIHRRDAMLLQHIVNYVLPKVTEHRIQAFAKEQFVLGVESAVKWLREQASVKVVLEELKSRVQQMKTGEDWADVYLKSLEHIHLDFITEMVELVVSTWS